MFRQLRKILPWLLCANLAFADDNVSDASLESDVSSESGSAFESDATTDSDATTGSDATPTPRGRRVHWRDRPIPFAPTDFSGDAFVRVDRLRAPVYARTSTRAGRGFVRQGVVLPATLVGRTESCPGTWWRIGSGYVCSAIGYDVRSRRPESLAASHAPRVDRGLPYRYAAVTDREAFRFESLPTERGLRRLREGAHLPGIGAALDGDYFVAFSWPSESGEGPEEHAAPGGPYVQTLDGRFVASAAIDFLEPSLLFGQYERQGLTLPMAIAIEETGTDSGYRFGRYTRFRVHGIEGDQVRMTHGLVPQSALRIARHHPRPSRVGEHEKWIHVDLDQQMLTAYEGDTPVFATLVASGKAGYDTPAGLFRIRHKHITTTMRGDDPIDGVYDVAEVPWTMYYDGSYALHGAYWHDTFGNVRSHGCTNLAPNDARFLFGWTSPVVPERWHGVREDGTWILLTREHEVEDLQIEHEHGDQD